jgi:hypothetical protein
MSIVTKKSAENRREPHERLRLTEDISVPFWVYRDMESGKKKLFWSIDRVGPDDTFRRLIPSIHILQLPEVIRQVAEILAELDFEPADRRRQFARLALAMAQIGELLREDLVNGQDNGGSQAKRSQVLSL